MAEPDVVRMMREFGAGVLAEEEKQFAAMVKVWLEVERSLEGQMSALALEIERARDAGIMVSMEQVRKWERFQRLLGEAKREVTKYEKYAEVMISGRQKELVEAGWANAEEAVRLARPADWQEFIGALPVKALENMVGLGGDGSPLAALLAKASEDSGVGLMRSLTQAVALGWNPAKTARAMADGLAGGLDRALLIARTEQMRVLRESARMGYQSSGVVVQYKRIASISPRTCLACLLSDGQLYDVTTDFEEHPAGRCGLVPVVVGVAEPQWETGRQWLLNQPDAVQQDFMGVKAWEAWRVGEVTLDEMVTRHEDGVWGRYLTPTGITELLGRG